MTQIDERFILLDTNSIEIPIEDLTQDYPKDIKILSFYALEKLPDTSKFNLKNWNIIEYSEDRLLIDSDERHYMLMIDDLVIINKLLTVDYRVYLIRD